MRALDFWKRIIRDRSDMLEDLLNRLSQAGIQYCVIGGQAVNAYVAPLVSLGLDLVVAAHQLSALEALLERDFHLRRFPHSLNISRYGSDLRVQIQTNPRYAVFIERAEARDVLGKVLPVASLEDVLKGKIWAVRDPERGGSKRQKDLADIARLLEAYPKLRQQTPADILHLLIE
jgi:hypothetical protein